MRDVKDIQNVQLTGTQAMIGRDSFWCVRSRKSLEMPIFVRALGYSGASLTPRTDELLLESDTKVN